MVCKEGAAIVFRNDLRTASYKIAAVFLASSAAALSTALPASATEQSPSSVAQDETSLDVGYRHIEDRRHAQLMAARLSGVPDDAGYGGIVVILYGTNSQIRDAIRTGAMQARDDNGERVPVRGVVTTTGNTNQFEVYGDGGPISRLLGPDNARVLAKSAIEQVHRDYIMTRFFDQESSPSR